MKILNKTILLLAFLLSSTLSAFSQKEHDAKFGKGVEFYTAGDYEAALREWNDLYNTGYRSATLSYNIGNACFKMNDIPSAILFYERAHLLKPGDSNINYNLQIARSLVVDKFEEIPELFFVRWYNFIALMFHTNTWAVISLATFLLFLALLSLYIYSSAYRLKVTSFWLSLLFLFISLSSLTFAIRNRNLVYESRSAVIFAPSVNGKSSPDSSGTDLFVLHEGSKVAIEDKVGKWYEIRLSDGNRGWVPEESLTII